MKVLVAAASRHGATAELAARIGTVLQEALRARALDSTVDVRPAEHVQSVAGYDAVVLGSAVYMGRWLAPARRLARAEADRLADVPVWLFSSGPVGAPPEPDADSPDVAAAMAATKARGHWRFAGKIDRSELGFAEKATVRVVRAPEGDFRDWPAVADWAADIAGALASKP